MSLWGSNGASTADKPLFAAHLAEGDLSADVVGSANAAVNGSTIQNPGWNLVRQGTGPVVSVAITAGGTGYANGEHLIFTANTSGDVATHVPAVVAATGTITTDGTGAITSITLTSGGSGYTKAPVVTVNTAAGTTATLVATVGGRANRTTYETLVVCSSLKA